jgi:hypothetical protein
MFAYSDPSKTGFLERSGALQAYREMVDRFYQEMHGIDDSGCTLRDAFDELGPGAQGKVVTVEWRAFPVTAGAPAEQIDRNRFRFQDEYVEWRAETSNNALARVTFTTEFPEYFEALAQSGAAALKDEIGRLIAGAAPTDQELFGPGFNPAAATPRTRAQRFRDNLDQNPWNNGERGILCLTQQFNTMGALFNLLGHCGVPRTDIGTSEVCGAVGNFCGDGRNSDPSVCAAAQNLARAKQSFCLEDPCGIYILRLDNSQVWQVDGQTVDINNKAANGGVWKVTRNGRRAVFDFSRSITFGGATIRTGARLSELLVVGADVLHAADTDLPEWARQGGENARNMV